MRLVAVEEVENDVDTPEQALFKFRSYFKKRLCCVSILSKYQLWLAFGRAGQVSAQSLVPKPQDRRIAPTRSAIDWRILGTNKMRTKEM